MGTAVVAPRMWRARSLCSWRERKAIRSLRPGGSSRAPRISNVRQICRDFERRRNSADRSKDLPRTPSRTSVHNGACVRADCLHSPQTWEITKGTLVACSGLRSALRANSNIGMRVFDESRWTGEGVCIATVGSVSERWRE